MIGVINEFQLSRCFSKFLLHSDDEEQEDEDGIVYADEMSSQEIRLHLRDILVSKLNSLSEEVVTTTLLLFGSLVRFHNGTCLDLLFEKLPKQISPIKISIQQHTAALDQCKGLLRNTTNVSGPHSLMVYLNEADKMRNSYRRGLRKGVSMSSRAPVKAILPARVMSEGALEDGLEQLRQLGKDTILRKFINKFRYCRKLTLVEPSLAIRLR
jgi:hypothetical protein